MNKILTSKYSRDLLDYIDVFQGSYQCTKSFLLNNNPGDPSILSLIVGMRFKAAKHLMSDAQWSLLFTYQKSDQASVKSSPPKRPSAKCFAQSLHHYLAKIQAGAGGLKIDLSWMQTALKFIKLFKRIELDEVKVIYFAGIQKKIHIMLYDKDHDVSSFYTKVKSQIKKGNFKLPFTNYELDRAEYVLQSILDSSIQILTNMIARNLLVETNSQVGKISSCSTHLEHSLAICRVIQDGQENQSTFSSNKSISSRSLDEKGLQASEETLDTCKQVSHSSAESL